MLIIVFISLLIILLINKNILADNYTLLNPISLMCYLWIIVLTLHCACYGINDYTEQTYFWIAIGLISTAIGFWLCANTIFALGRNHAHKSERVYDMQYLKKVCNVFTGIKFIHTLYLFYSIVIKIAGSWYIFLTRNTYVRNLYLERNTWAVESILSFVFSANVYLGYVLLGIYTSKVIYDRENNREKQHAYALLFIWIIFETISAYITMSKMSLFVFLLVFAITYFNNLGSTHLQRKVLKVLPLALFGSFGFLILIANQRNYAANGTSVVQQVLDKIVLYFSGGVEALGMIISKEKSAMYMGAHTFKFITRILHRLGLISGSVSVHKDPIITSLGTTNVYTWFHDFYLDYSYVGFSMMPLLMGILAGIFYNIRENSLSLNTCTAYFSMAVVFSFYTFMFEQNAYIFVMLYALFMERTLLKRIYLVRNYEEC